MIAQCCGDSGAPDKAEKITGNIGPPSMLCLHHGTSGIPPFGTGDHNGKTPTESAWPRAGNSTLMRTYEIGQPRTVCRVKAHPAIAADATWSSDRNRNLRLPRASRSRTAGCRRLAFARGKTSAFHRDFEHHAMVLASSGHEPAAPLTRPAAGASRPTRPTPATAPSRLRAKRFRACTPV